MREWPKNLQRIATMPTFACLAGDGDNDGGIPGNASSGGRRLQDAWSRRAVEPPFDSAARCEQKSPPILTRDESDATANNRIATIVLGSRNTAKSGYAGRLPRDHYGTARTIEAALGPPFAASIDRATWPDRCRPSCASNFGQRCRRGKRIVLRPRHVIFIYTRHEIDYGIRQYP